MRKCFSILRYEYKMQIRRAATWGVFAAATGIALADNYPSAGNLARLEFLVQPAYFVCRTMSLDALVMVFGLMFLLSGRIPIDRKTGVQSLMMASPASKGQYIFGKMFGGLLYTLTMVSLFLTLNTLIYFIAAPFSISAVDCLVPLVKTIAVCGLPVSVFIGFISVALPAAMDTRLFYLLASVLFILNAASVGSAEQMPFYLITSGDLTKLIWQHPKYPFVNSGSVQANLLFLVGSGLAVWILPLTKRKLWRTEL